jgi:hypothetical protein
MRTSDARFLALIIFGVLGDPAAAQEATDMRLTSAGFVMRPANTPEALARLRHLPPRKFVARTKPNGVRYFLYADADYCRCVLVGDQRAMNTYRDMVSPPPGLPGVPDSWGRSAQATSEHAMIEEMNSDLNSGIPDGDILDWGQ